MHPGTRTQFAASPATAGHERLVALTAVAALLPDAAGERSRLPELIAAAPAESSPESALAVAVSLLDWLAESSPESAAPVVASLLYWPAELLWCLGLRCW